MGRRGLKNLSCPFRQHLLRPALFFFFFSSFAFADGLPGHLEAYVGWLSLALPYMTPWVGEGALVIFWLHPEHVHNVDDMMREFGLILSIGFALEGM
jgi:hypothetical protein